MKPADEAAQFFRLRGAPARADAESAGSEPRLAETFRFQVEPGETLSFHYITVTASSVGFLVTWSRSDLLAMRFDQSGQPLDFTPLSLGATIGWSYPSSDGTNYLVGLRTEFGRLKGRIIQPDGTMTAPVDVARGVRLTDGVATAWGHGMYIFAGITIANDNRVVVWRVNANGTPIDATPQLLNPHLGKASYNARVAAGSEGFLVVWQSRDGLLAAALNREGIRITDPKLISKNSGGDGTPSVAFDRNRYVVTWRGSGGTLHNPELPILVAALDQLADVQITEHVIDPGWADSTVVIAGRRGPHLFWVNPPYPSGTVYTSELRPNLRERQHRRVIEENASAGWISAARLENRALVAVGRRQTTTTPCNLVVYSLDLR